MMRLFTNLADRDAYMSRAHDGRLDAVRRGQAFGLSEADAAAIMSADETDRVCGAALRKLRVRVNIGVVDVLGWLDHERVAALLLALPTEARQAIIDADGVWGVAWQSIDHKSIWELQLHALDRERGGPEYAAQLSEHGMGEGRREGIRETAERLADLMLAPEDRIRLRAMRLRVFVQGMGEEPSMSVEESWVCSDLPPQWRDLMYDEHWGLEEGDVALDMDLAGQLAEVGRKVRARQWRAIERIEALNYAEAAMPEDDPTIDEVLAYERALATVRWNRDAPDPDVLPPHLPNVY
jgi:hypothetical protein